MRFYGGLRTKIPLTFWAMVAGTLAITGVGLEPIFGFAGFYSKDAIIAAAFARGTTLGYVAWTAGVGAALLTSFYSWRLIFMTFFGEPRWAASEHIQHAMHAAHGHGHTHEHDAAHPAEHGHHAGHAIEHHSDSDHEAPDEGAGAEPRADSRGMTEVEHGTAGYEPHESPWAMLLPLVVLSFGAVFAGWLFQRVFVLPEGAPGFWRGSLVYSAKLMEATEDLPVWAKYAPLAVMLIGLAIAWNSYIRNLSVPQRFTSTFRGLYLFLLNKWYFDELYDFLFVRPSFAIGRFLWQRGDKGTIDRFGPDGVAHLVSGTSRLTARLQSGYVYTYALVMLLGLCGAATWAWGVMR